MKQLVPSGRRHQDRRRHVVAEQRDPRIDGFDAVEHARPQADIAPRRDILRRADLVHDDRDDRVGELLAALADAAADVAGLLRHALLVHRAGADHGVVHAGHLVHLPPEGGFVELARACRVVRRDLKMSNFAAHRPWGEHPPGGVKTLP